VIGYRRMILLYGENTVASRDELTKLLTASKAEGHEVIRLEAKKLTQAELETVLGETDLFGTNKTIVIEGLHSLPKSKKKNELIALLTQPSDHSIILWEKRSLTKAMLNQFPSARATEFKMSNLLFNWLDAFGATDQKNSALQNLHKAFKKDGEYLCFIMLIRQIRLLLLAKTGGTIKGPPFMVTKYSSQARRFSTEQLLALHTHLTELDEKTKVSQTTLTLQSQLDLLTLGVYI